MSLFPLARRRCWKAEKILSGLGFSEDEFYHSPAEFSGGFQVRLNLAKVLLAEPHLLLLDEPTNYPDIISIRWLTKFLQRWSNELMIITHDREFMNSITTHTVAIHRQKVKKVEGDTIKLFEQIAVEEEVYEKTRSKEQKKREETMEFINRFRASAARASLVQSRVKALEKMGNKEALALEEINLKLTEAVVNSNGDEIKKLQITAHEKQQALDLGYKELETLIAELDVLDKSKP